VDVTGRLTVALKTDTSSVWGWDFSIKQENGPILASGFCTQVSNGCNPPSYEPKSFSIEVGQARLGAFIVKVKARNSFSIPDSPYQLMLSFEALDSNDIDTDGDNVADPSDAFPLDNSEILDSDGDGVGDNTDIFPNDPVESSDNDNDGIGDNADNDDDDDGVEDINYPITTLNI
jgi:hypothetical protein